MSFPRFLLCAGLWTTAVSSGSAEPMIHSWTKLHLSDEFWSEGAGFGDLNRDGRMDIVSGPYWFAGPEFTVRHAFHATTNSFTRKTARGAEETRPGWNPEVYSDDFFAFVHDFNNDQWPDILKIGFPGKEAAWFENPQGSSGLWKRHVVFEAVDNESPHWTDLTGDGRPEIICNHDGYFGYVQPDWSAPERPWTFHPISTKGAWNNFTHGLGVGDVNGDGRLDLLESGGWWEQLASTPSASAWARHAFDFGPGGAQMHAYDVDGDGDNDIVTSLVAHGFGLAWFEHVRQNGRITFRQHTIMNKEPHENRYGLKFSMLHAVELADMDGDGLKDIVTGKRYWLPGYRRETEPGSPSPVYWFRLVRQNEAVDFVPYPIDPGSGLGVQLSVGDVNGDALPDVVVANKNGTFVFVHQTRKASQAEWEAAQPQRAEP